MAKARYGVVFLCLGLLISPGSGTGWAQELPPPASPPAAKVGHPKLPSVLQELYERFTADPEQGRAFAQRNLLPQHRVGDAVRLLLWPEGYRASAIPRSALQALGVTVEAQSQRLLRVLVPIPRLVALAGGVPGIRALELPLYTRPIDPPVLAQTVSEGVALTGADTYHDNGITGNGVKVAVIDLGFEGIQNAIDSGEFGSPHRIDPNCTKNYITNQTGIAAVDTDGDHGVSVAHAVYNMAPGAILCLKLIGDLVDLENAVNDAIAEGVRVINHSVAWVNVNSYYDGTGFIDDLATTAFNNGILWVNAAGNFADGVHWQGNFVDTDNDGWHEFAPGDECNEFSLDAGTFLQLFMNWDDYPASDQDYDLYVFDSNLNVVASSENPQDGSQPPEEGLAFSVPATDTYCWGIRNYSGPATDEIEVFTFTTLAFEHEVKTSSLPDPANGPNVLAVAAIWHPNYETGPQEPFSSQGPTNDSKAASSRVEPSIAGPDGTTDYDGGSAFGTSFAAPHVAGCAALIWEANPTFTPAQVRAKLEGDAIDMGASGKDNIYGWGRLNCPFADPDPTAAVFTVGNDGTVAADRAYFCGLPSGCFNTGTGADLAERVWVTEPVEPGDVVEIDPENPGRYRKARGPYSPRVAGVIATQPAITLANRPEELARLPEYLSALAALQRLGLRPLLAPDPAPALRDGPRVSVAALLAPHAAPTSRGLLAQLTGYERAQRVLQRVGLKLPGRPLLALMGRVWVKATAENGPIRVGDLLTTASRPGYAMRCPDPSACEGALVGKALEPLPGGEGLIEVLLLR